MVGSRVMDRLRTSDGLRRLYHAGHTARSVSPRGAFVRDFVRGRTAGTYRSRRTGQLVTFRPRLDLQVAREQLSMEGYAPPAELIAVIGDPRPKRILDLGANIGLFTLSALARDPQATVVAVEPDPDNLELLRKNVAQNGLDGAVQVVAAAAGTGPGRVRFAAGKRELSHVVYGEAKESDGIDVEIVDMFELAQGCDQLKIDIEGGEWPILRDPRFAKLEASLIVMEWHEPNADAASPKLEAERLLREAGYEVQHHGRDVPWAGEIWAYRPSLRTTA